MSTWKILAIKKEGKWQLYNLKQAFVDHRNTVKTIPIT